MVVSSGKEWDADGVGIEHPKGLQCGGQDGQWWVVGSVLYKCSDLQLVLCSLQLHEGKQRMEGPGMSWHQESEVAMWEGSGDNQVAQTGLVRAPH